MSCMPDFQDKLLRLEVLWTVAIQVVIRRLTCLGHVLRQGHWIDKLEWLAFQHCLFFLQETRKEHHLFNKREWLLMWWIYLGKWPWHLKVGTGPLLALKFWALKNLVDFHSSPYIFILVSVTKIIKPSHIPKVFPAWTTPFKKYSKLNLGSSFDS